MTTLPRAYLAGPDVFLRDALDQAGRKRRICAAHGLEGVSPLDDEATAASWRAIYAHNLQLMRSCDLVIANLTPFRGASGDAGTLVEIGWFLGRSLPVFGYSNSAVEFGRRSELQREAVADPLPDLAVEAFGLADNLMIVGACVVLEVPSAGETLAFDSLVVFERCAARAGGLVS